MSKFVKNSIFLADTLKIQVSLEPRMNLNLFYFSTNKIKTLSLFFNDIILLKKKKYLLYLITEEQEKNVIGLIFVRLLRLILDSIAPTRKSLILLGIGFNVIQNNNCLLFNVGTSQSLSWMINSNLFFRILGKKQNQIKFYTISKQFLSDILWSIIALRKPNIYTGKGIYYNKVKFKTKIGKIKKM